MAKLELPHTIVDNKSFNFILIFPLILYTTTQLLCNLLFAWKEKKARGGTLFSGKSVFMGRQLLLTSKVKKDLLCKWRPSIEFDQTLK